MDPNTNFTPDLLTVLEQGRAILTSKREAARAAADAETTRQQAQFDREWAEVIDAVVTRWPFLGAGVKAPALDPQKHFDNDRPGGRSSVVVSVEIPGLDRFEIEMRQHSAGNGAPTVWQPDEPAIKLTRPYLGHSSYGGEAYVTRDEREREKFKSADLPLALALAAEFYDSRVELQIEADTENQARIARFEARAAKEAPTPTEDQVIASHVRALFEIAAPRQEEI